MTTPFMSGRQVFLRGIQKADVAAMATWTDDPDVTRLLFRGLRPAHAPVLEEEWEREQRDPSTANFAVCDGKDGAFIGTTGVFRIDWVMRHGEFRVFLGDKKSWNRGIGTECAKLMVVYGMEKLNLNKVWLGVNAANVGGVRAYEKAGFVREGILRQEQYRNFEYYDVIRMSILRSEYASRCDGYLDRDREMP
jgi:RimJ/RimL family protein N-acetyltransferase